MKVYKTILIGLLALCLSCHSDKSEVKPDSVISLSYDTSKTYTADGTSTVTLTISINPQAGADYRKVTLVTGTGVFENNSNTTTLDYRLINTGTVDLTVGTIPEKYLITATIGTTTTFSDQKQITLVALKKNKVFKSIGGATTLTGLLANGQSEVNISVTLGFKTTVTFSTESGTFHDYGKTPGPSITVDVDPENKASAIFTIGRTAGPCSIHIQTPVPRYDTTIIFNAAVAYPQLMVMEVSKVLLDNAGDEADVKVILSRTTGKVSLGINVLFPEILVNNNLAVSYTPLSSLSDQNGEVSTKLLFMGGVTMGKSIVIQSQQPQSGLQTTRTLNIK